MALYREIFHRVVGSFPMVEFWTLAYLTDPQGNLLMTQGENDGYWRLPGGPIRPEEDMMNCLQRTVLDQTGVLIEAGYLIRVFSDASQRYIETDDARVYPIYAVFSAASTRGRLERIEGSRRRFRFFSAENIPGDRVFPPMLPAVRFFSDCFSDGIPLRLVDVDAYIRYERPGEPGREDDFEL